MMGNINSYKAFKDKHKASGDVWDFLGQLRYRATGDQTQATTWLELYILYRCMGYTKPIEDRANKARARAGVQMQLNQFKKDVRGVVDRAIYDKDQLDVFKPIKVSKQKYEGLAVKGKYQAVHMDIRMTPQQREVVERHVITLGHNIAAIRVESFRKGEIGLLPYLPKLKGKAGWDSKNTHLAGNPLRSLKHIAQQSEDSNEQGMGYPICLACPRCSTEYASNSLSINTQDLDSKCKCNNCKGNIKARDWMRRAIYHTLYRMDPQKTH